MSGGRLVPAVAMIGRRFPQVLKAVAGGDEDVFGVLWHELQPRLLRYFTVMAPAAAEALAAQTWLGVVDGLGQCCGSEPAFRAWVFSLARHQLLDWRRRGACIPTERLPTADSLQPIADDACAATTLDALSPGAALGLVATLPTDQAEAITLRVVAELDVGQVAELMGERPDTVRVLIHRGLRRLAERLGAGAHLRGGRVTR
jgi:RNA polymerase sigma-70 factor, ECF subfamily